MLGVFVGINSETTQIVDECKAKISVLDQAKTPYVKAARNIDQNLHDQITSVNDTLYATRDAYDERIDVQECKSDLFWRLTGITSVANGGGHQNSYTFTCTKLSTVYEKSASGVTTFSAGAGATVGFSTNRVVRLQNDGSFYSFELGVEGDKLISVGSTLDTYYEPDNLLYQQALTETYEHGMEEGRLQQAFERISEQSLCWMPTEHPTPFSFPIITDRLRGKMSSEKLEDRIKRMLKQLNKILHHS